MSTITETAVHYYGHGQSWFLPRTTGGVIDGTVATGISLPEVDSLSISLTTEKVERVSKRDEVASKAVSFVRMVGATGKIVCSQHTMDLFKLYFFGTKATVSGGQPRCGPTSGASAMAAMIAAAPPSSSTVVPKRSSRASRCGASSALASAP